MWNESAFLLYGMLHVYIVTVTVVDTYENLLFFFLHPPGIFKIL